MKAARCTRLPVLGAALLVGALLLPAVPASAAAADEQIAPGVGYRTFQLSTEHGPVVGYLVTVDLTNPRTNLTLLYPDKVAAKDEIPDLTNAAHAVAGVNGDFFNISDEHSGIVATSSAVGPAMSNGEALKFAVPDGQRFGPALPAGTSAKDVFVLGADRKARVSTLMLTGAAHGPDGDIRVSGLNQYALPVGTVGVFTDDWGDVSRARAVCGTDTDRSAPCSTDTEEVVIRDGVVSSEGDQPGAGPIDAGTVVLVGREAGATALEELDPGEHVTVHTHMTATNSPAPRVAVGGFPILRDGAPLRGLDTAELAPRTAAGVSADGHTVYLLAVDGRSAASTGFSVRETAATLREFGADDGMNLDGGGSTTMVVRDPGAPTATVRNVPSDGVPRQVANGLGVVVR